MEDNEIIANKIVQKTKDYLFSEDFKKRCSNSMEHLIENYLEEYGEDDGDLNLDCGGPFYTEESISEAHDAVLDNVLDSIEKDFDIEFSLEDIF